MQREIERLLVLSLSAEEAVRAERWEEVVDLLQSRDAILTQLESHSLGAQHDDALRQVRQADARIGQALADVRSSLVDEIAGAFQSRRAQGAYSPPAGTQGTRWDRSG